MKVEKIPALIGLVLIILLAFLIIWQAGIFGVSKGRLEQDARDKQGVEKSWVPRPSMRTCAPCSSMTRRRRTTPTPSI